MQHYWRAVSNEFVNRYAKDYPFYYTMMRYYPDDEQTTRENIDRKTYRFNEDGTLYLTQREADCIYFMVQGHTITSTAQELLLSPRTVEFYLKRIKEKFKIKSKKQLLLFIQSNEHFHDFFHAIKAEFEN